MIPHKTWSLCGKIISTSVRKEKGEKTYLVCIEFTIRTNVKQAAGCVIGASTEGISVREELDCVDVGLMTSKSLNSLAGTDVPQFGKGVTGSRDEDVLVSRVDADGHDVAEMVGKFGDLGSGLNIPQHACHVSG